MPVRHAGRRVRRRNVGCSPATKPSRFSLDMGSSAGAAASIWKKSSITEGVRTPSLRHAARDRSRRRRCPTAAAQSNHQR